MSANLNELSRDNLVIDVTNTDKIERGLVQLHNHLVNKETTTLVGNIWNEICVSSPAKKVVIGGVSGWCTGVFVSKIGKFLLFTIGGSVIVLQLAQSQGLIQIDWESVEEKFSKTQEKLKTKVSDNFPTFIEQVKNYGAREVYLSGSFCLGLFLGMFF